MSKTELEEAPMTIVVGLRERYSHLLSIKADGIEPCKGKGSWFSPVRRPTAEAVHAAFGAALGGDSPSSTRGENTWAPGGPLTAACTHTHLAEFFLRRGGDGDDGRGSPRRCRHAARSPSRSRARRIPSRPGASRYGRHDRDSRCRVISAGRRAAGLGAGLMF